MTEQIDKKNYFIEPVEIEIYLKKAGIVRTIEKDMFIELVDPEPTGDHSQKIFSYFKEKDEPIDLCEIMNLFPEYIKIIYDSYYQYIEFFEKLSMHIKTAIRDDSNSAWKQALYFTEMLLKNEPTYCSTKLIGDFQTYNINYLIRKLNTLNLNFFLEDSTVNYLIKRHLEKHKNDEKQDKEFLKLYELWRFNITEKDPLL